MPERTLIKGGTIVSMDREVGDLRRGDVLIEDGVIAAVGASLEVADCRTIEAEGMVVLPGLVDSHRHLWYTGVRGWGMDSVMDELINGLWPKLAAHYSPEDLYACNRAAIAEALDQGITTVFDWCHLINSPAHADEALRAGLVRELHPADAVLPAARAIAAEIAAASPVSVSFTKALLWRASTADSLAHEVPVSMQAQGQGELRLSSQVQQTPGVA